MNLSIKDKRYIVEALELLLQSYSDKMALLDEDKEEDENELANDTEFVKYLLTDLRESLSKYEAKVHASISKPLSQEVTTNINE